MQCHTKGEKQFVQFYEYNLLIQTETLQMNMDADGEAIKNNFRPVQPIGARELFYYNPLNNPASP
jgi:hypothetical protein